MDENQELNTVENVPVEPMVPQSHVNKLLAREAEKSASKARQDAEANYQRQLEALQAKQEQRNAEVPREYDANAIYQQVQEKFNEEMLRKQHEAHVSQVADSYLSKMQQGHSTYGDDFKTAMQDFDPAAFPQLVYLVSGMDNAADIMYDIAKNPMKLASLDALAIKNPRLAHAELTKLSGSIATNKQATQDAGNQETAAPLDRLQPSRTTQGNGKMSISDLRNQPWLRG